MSSNGNTLPDGMELTNCDLCGKNDFKIVYRGALKAEEGSSKKAEVVYKSSGHAHSTDTIVTCSNCSLSYVNPRLKPEEIIAGYSEGSDETFVSQSSSREATFQSGVKFIEQFAKPGKILDVGTAGGSFLYSAKKRGWQVYGVEPNKWLCEWAKKKYDIYIQPGTIDDLNYPEGFFDAITLWDVIEHVPNPSEVLRKCHRLLKPGGCIYLNYPDYGSYVSRIMGKRWVFLLSVHIYYFTRETIAKILQKEGFSPLKYRTHFQTLTLGYLVYRMSEYSKLLCKLGNFWIKLFRMQNFPIKYWLGQSGIIARKK